MSEGLPRVSVVVPVKDRREEMLRCLDALLAQDYPDYEVFVLDNGSSDGTAEACRERARGAPVPVHVESVPGGPGGVRNRGSELASGEIVAFTDSDCWSSPGWLRAGVAPFADPEIGLVTGTTMPDPEAELTGWYFTQQITDFTGRFETCNLFVRRDAFRDSKGFDEQVYNWEDTAGGYALMRLGWKPGFAKDALVHHVVTYPPYSWWLRRGEVLGNAARVVRRYPEIRRDLLWLGVFNQKRTAKLVAALAGLMLARRLPPALLLAVPYARERAPRTVTLDWVQPVVYDLATLAWMVRGSVRERTLVL